MNYSVTSLHQILLKYKSKINIINIIFALPSHETKVYSFFLFIWFLAYIYPILARHKFWTSEKNYGKKNALPEEKLVHKNTEQPNKEADCFKS